MAELLLPVVRGVACKAADTLVKTITAMCGVDGERGKLERHLLAVQCLLSDAEVKNETNLAVKRWMKDLKAVAYEADDVLDDFHYEALRREVMIGNSIIRKVLGYFTRQRPLLFCVTMSKRLSNVLRKINDLVEEMNKFGLVERSEPPQIPYRQTHSRLGMDEAADIFGRDVDKEVVVKLILDQRDQQELQVFPIIGMGGLGKTTLAKMVYNDPSVQEHFHLKMWHCVSDNFEAISLVKSVIELATNRRCGLPDTIELLRERLEEVIAGKEEKRWEDDLKPLLNSVGAPGSIIIVTTRSRRVASIMGTLRPYELACLTEDESWELFSRKAFGRGVQEQAVLVNIGRRIAKTCKGLPLALKTMGGLMSSKQQVKEWEAIARSDIGDNVRGKDEILSLLKLSYRHLPSEMKQCFTFCAIFAKDYEMEKDRLIQLWIANGFIQEEGTIELAQKGEFTFNELVWRSFLQDVKQVDLASEDCPGSSDGLIVCKMHDLMHDLAKHVSDECATTEELIQQRASSKDVYHMQISRYELRKVSELYNGMTSLCTLLMAVSSHEYFSDLNLRSFFLERLKLRSLRGLWCECYYDPSIITCQLTNTKHLRYLDLSKSSILPDSICTLYNLKSLRLNDCKRLKCLPEGMTDLRRLNHLYLLGCTDLERMPPNISVLTNLQTLTTFVVDTKDGCGIEEPQNLRYLTNQLELYNLREIKSVSNAKESNLHKKQDLSTLQLCWGRGLTDKPRGKDSNEDEEMLESLAPHGKIKILKVYGYGGSKVSVWMDERPSNISALEKARYYTMHKM
uniref:NB-ARC domain-containing protein n=1 Tax=Leersia perrieri TaxID=77586 RepID=A0A0D9XAD7_9ORYZ